MDPTTLASRDNPLVKRFRKVARAPKGGRAEGVFLLEGRHVLEEALRVSWPLAAVLMVREAWPAWAPRLERARAAGTEIRLVSPELLGSLGTQAAPEDVLALGVRRAPDWPRPAPAGRYLLLDAIQDPVNVGILVRSAVAFGFDAVFAGPGTADPFGPAALARSAGAALHRPPVPCGVRPLLDWCAAGGVEILAAEGGAAPPGEEWSPGAPLLLCLGNERHGLSAELLTAARRVGVAMAPGWDSLNVAAAGAVLMHGLARL